MAPIPIVICGRNPVNATRIRQNLLPEYEVIHNCLTPSAATIDISQLLSDKSPLNHADNIGSQNYSQRPAAIVLGGAFTSETYEELRAACKGLDEVLWLRADETKPRPGQARVDQEPSVEQQEAFALETAQRVKGALDRARADGKTEGVFLY